MGDGILDLMKRIFFDGNFIKNLCKLSFLIQENKQMSTIVKKSICVPPRILCGLAVTRGLHFGKQQVPWRFSDLASWRCLRAPARSKEAKGIASGPVHLVWPCFLSVFCISILFKHWLIERTSSTKCGLLRSHRVGRMGVHTLSIPRTGRAHWPTG